MAIVRHEVPTCCGNKALVFDLPVAINRQHVQKFIDLGYTIPKHFLAAGIFYVENGPLIASGAFGTTKLNVRCSTGVNCLSTIDGFEATLNEVLLQ